MKWKDLPIGTIICCRTTKGKWKKISDTQEIVIVNYKGEKVEHSSDQTTAVITIDEIVTENYDIIIPYGYQTPLWKVLNGESIE